jgi:Protein of unknown function (DUF4197)
VNLSRRSVIIAAAATPILVLPGCAGGLGFSLVDAIRRLLGLSSQRAFASLLRENGFLDDNVARISLPDALGGDRATSIVSAVLTSGAFRSRLGKQLNRAAEKGAELAAPVVADAITNLGVEDAAKIVAGGGSAATDLLKAAMGNALIGKMLPGIDGGLRLFDSPVVTEALRQVTNIDFAGIRDDVTRKASEGIYKAIGREEIAIRADPSGTNDPLLIGVFGIAARG